ncbi:TetR/AcrR family transcriptional regulator [Palleniella muris]|uniref:TetR/AcrR family transcriptional regulator n=1 Tax=Palleniella muris TaxID=3038145 RepID=A0AC61QSR5_9BACT|nr:TetR/AcrR family transcriptional regulator [Palleniella muris]
MPSFTAVFSYRYLSSFKLKCSELTKVNREYLERGLQLCKFALTKLLNETDSDMDKSEKDTEQRILEAAIKEFSLKGFDGARTASIAAEAGVTHAMLHYYFRTKEKLFECVFKDKMQYVLDMVLVPIVRAEGSIKERICKGIEAHFDFLMANKDLPLFVFTTLHSRPEMFREAVNGLAPVFREQLKEVQCECDKAHEAGEIGRVDVPMLLCDIACLNVFPFLASPMMMVVAGYPQERYGEFMEMRKRETVETILKRIQ